MPDPACQRASWGGGFPTTHWCWGARQGAGVAGANLSQAGFCQPACDTWLLNPSRQPPGIRACVALTSVAATATVKQLPDVRRGQERRDEAVRQERCFCSGRMMKGKALGSVGTSFSRMGFAKYSFGCQKKSPQALGTTSQTGDVQRAHRSVGDTPAPPQISWKICFSKTVPHPLPKHKDITLPAPA